MTNLKEGLYQLKEVINNVLSKNIDFESKLFEQEFDYKKREREYYAKEIESALKRVEVLLSESFVIAQFGEKVALTKAANEIKELKKQIKSKDLLQALVSIEKAHSLAPLLKISEENLPKTRFDLPYIPRAIFQEVKTNFDEIEKCFEHNCYRSALILCGKILEIALHRKYFDHTGIDLLEKSPDIGLGNLIVKLKSKGVDIDPGLANQIHLINQLRVYTVHKKRKAFNPSKTQTQASILYTIDILRKIFQK